MTNKSMGDFAYSIFDVNSHIEQHTIDELNAIPGMIKVRLLV